jgi:hypothetical protein
MGISTPIKVIIKTIDETEVEASKIVIDGGMIAGNTIKPIPTKLRINSNTV